MRITNVLSDHVVVGAINVKRLCQSFFFLIGRRWDIITSGLAILESMDLVLEVGECFMSVCVFDVVYLKGRCS